MCSGESYNDDLQICCRGRTHNLMPGWKCCGHWYHDPTAHYCCRWGMLKMSLVTIEAGKNRTDSCNEMREKMKPEKKTE